MSSALLSQAAELHRAGRLDEAEAIYRQVVAADGANAEAWHLLGTLLIQTDRAREAVQLIRRAIALDSKRADFHLNLAVALLKLSLAGEAANSCQTAIAMRPDWPEAWFNLGCALATMGQGPRAVEAYQCAVKLKPDYGGAWFNLGDALRTVGRGGEAMECFRKAAEISPSSQALNNLGTCLLEEDRYAEAIEVYRRALAIQPDSVNAQSNLGQALLGMGRAAQAVEVLGQIRHVPFVADNLLWALHFVPGRGPEEIFQEHVDWDRRFSRPLAREILPPTNDRDPNRRLKIGYVSSDFRLHSVAFFLENLLDYHDPQQVEVFAYADVGQPDAVTRRLQQSIHQWRSIYGKSDVEVARMIRQDQIDILVDLAGHTAGNRLLVFARKPAPVQITYLGYPDTTGLTAIDYRMTDIYADPLGQTEKYHSEKLLRLPRTFACYRPPAEATEVSPLPAVTYGRVTFACFTTLGKLPPNLLDCWAEILIQVPTSRLLIAAGGLQSNDLQREIRSHFERRGIDPTRLDLMGKRPLSEYFSLHHQVDIYLDTFPVNGHTVTCHALWMGLPVVTLAGSVHCQRLGASVLSNLGTGELIAKSPQEYVQIAASLAGDVPKLKAMRSNLREKMKSSPILDAAQFARDVEGAYREIWKNWCAGSV